MILHTFPSHAGFVSVAWDDARQTYYARGREWEHAHGLLTLALLRAALLGHHIALPGQVADHLLYDRRPTHPTSGTARGKHRNGRS